MKNSLPKRENTTSSILAHSNWNNHIHPRKPSRPAGMFCVKNLTDAAFSESLRRRGNRKGAVPGQRLNHISMIRSVSESLSEEFAGLVGSVIQAVEIFF